MEYLEYYSARKKIAIRDNRNGPWGGYAKWN